MDKHEPRSTAAQVHAMVSQHFTAGQRVQIQFDSDGAAGSGGIIRTVFPSGRCLVDLDRGGFRNLPPVGLAMEHEIPQIDAPRSMAWEFTEQFDGTCAIDGHAGQIAVRFFRHCGKIFPEVTKLIEYVARLLESPTTAERLCGVLYETLDDRFALGVEVRWESVSHAPITCRIDPSEVPH